MNQTEHPISKITLHRKKARAESCAITLSRSQLVDLVKRILYARMNGIIKSPEHECRFRYYPLVM
jgi:hypothetical protein